MLSTSENKVQQFPYLLIAIAILAVLLVLAVPRMGVIPAFSSEQDLTKLNSSAVSAYRWGEMANFYSSQQAGIPVTAANLTTLSDADISAYRWQAMAAFHAKQTSAKVKYGPPGR